MRKIFFVILTLLGINTVSFANNKDSSDKTNSSAQNENQNIDNSINNRYEDDDNRDEWDKYHEEEVFLGGD